MSRKPATSFYFATVLLAAAGLSVAQEPTPQDRIAALKQLIQEGQAKIRQYEWIETTVVSLKGEEKSRKQNRCYYGADGKVQKTAIEQPDQGSSDGGRRKKRIKTKIVAKKKAEMTAEMQRAADLLHMYVPPDPERIQKSKDAGKASMTPVEPGGPARLTFSDYLLEGDTFSITLDPANGLVGASVKSYLDAPKNGVHLDVSFANLPDGASYPATVDLVVESEKIHVKVEQSGHRKAAP